MAEIVSIITQSMVLLVEQLLPKSSEMVSANSSIILLSVVLMEEIVAHMFMRMVKMKGEFCNTKCG